MKVSLLIQFQGRAEGTDADMYREELAIAEAAEDLGFDRLMVVEHHFTHYAMSPDNAQTLSYLAAKTSTIDLMPAAFILPWNDPVRVAEKAVLLDHLSGGRAVLGLGRGLARAEFERFRIDMAESRKRYDEAAAMILEALETGVMEGDGPHYPQPRTEIRPRPLRSFKGRSYMVGGSPESLVTAARLGLGVMQFGVAGTPEAAAAVAPYREAFRAQNGHEPPPLITADLLVCDEDANKAEKLAREHQAGYWYRVMNHYELLSHHFEDQKGAYNMYADWAEELRNDKNNEAVNKYVDQNLWGDPDQVIDQIRAKYEAFGGIEIAIMASYADLPYDAVHTSLKLFSERVLPEIKSWPEIPETAGAAV